MIAAFERSPPSFFFTHTPTCCVALDVAAIQAADDGHGLQHKKKSTFDVKSGQGTLTCTVGAPTDFAMKFVPGVFVTAYTESAPRIHVTLGAQPPGIKRFSGLPRSSRGQATTNGIWNEITEMTLSGTVHIETCMVFVLGFAITTYAIHCPIIHSTMGALPPGNKASVQFYHLKSPLMLLHR